ncbi:flagellar hook-basal body protein FliE [Rhodovulum sp. NI22]|nr:flagellar hook-basal body protein FliE [Rhodovulum sp. NI22]
MDITSSTAAAQAYATARPATRPSPKAAAEEGGFARLAREFTETLQNGESTAKAAMTGGADPHALVQALAQTELAVETAVTVRDKVVEAYQEILRMPV